MAGFEVTAEDWKRFVLQRKRMVIHKLQIGYITSKKANPFPNGLLYKLLKVMWCGEGDLNPHEIAPASTSKHLTGFCRGSPGLKSLRFREPGIAVLRGFSGGPLQNRCS
jgi:hypothetical protein